MAAPLIPNARLTHGTIECRDILTSRRFYTEFLGLGSVRPLPEAQYLWQGGPWSLVCVGIEEFPRPQGSENRFGLRVATPSDVDAAHAAAVRDQAAYDIRDVGAVGEADGIRGFTLRDLDGNWWEIYHRPAVLYDELFARGDAPG